MFVWPAVLRGGSAKVEVHALHRVPAYSKQVLKLGGKIGKERWMQITFCLITFCMSLNVTECVRAARRAWGAQHARIRLPLHSYRIFPHMHWLRINHSQHSHKGGIRHGLVALRHVAGLVAEALVIDALVAHPAAHWLEH